MTALLHDDPWQVKQWDDIPIEEKVKPRTCPESKSTDIFADCNSCENHWFCKAKQDYQDLFQTSKGRHWNNYYE